MLDNLRDPRLEAAIRTLQTLPEEDPAAVDRIVAAARAQRGTAGLIPRESERRGIPGWGRGLGAALAAATVFGVGFIAGDSGRTGTSPNVVASSPVTGDVGTDTGIGQLVANGGDMVREPAPVPTTFHLQANDARDVALVGDFNAWNPSASPLVRSPVDGSWSGTVSLRPGRYTYAFMIDGKIVPDPAAVNVRDPDYDAIVSTIIVREMDP